MSGGRITRDHRYAITPEHLILDPRLSDRAVRMWCRLERFAGDNGAAYPTRETLAIELRCSPAAVDRAKKELVDAGWLRVEPQPGAASNYVLTTAPTKDTQKVIQESRKALIEATAPRREKRSARRKASKRGSGAAVSVNGSSDEANSQVSGGGVLTGDDPPVSPVSEGGVLTGDDPGVLTGDDRGVLTGDAHKEAPPKGSTSEMSSDSSLRSSSAAAADEALPGMPDSPTAEAEEEAPNAFAIAGDFLNWYEANRNGGIPVLKRERCKAALAKEYIQPALDAGVTVDQIKRALTECRNEWPSQAEWRDRLREQVTGHNVVHFPGRRRAYDDIATHGDPEERRRRLEASNARNPEDIDAEVDAMFSTGD